MKISGNSAAVRRMAPVLVVLIAVAVGADCLRAQDIGSVSPSLSDPLSPSTQTTGFNQAFDATASNVVNEDPHSDVNDATHSQLLGSAIAPIDQAGVFSSAETAPRTGVLTDAQGAVGATDSYFGGRQSRAFTVGGEGSASGGASGRQLAAAGLGAGTMRASFTGASGSRIAFSGAAAPNTAAAVGFSGAGIAAARNADGVGYTQSLTAESQGDLTGNSTGTVSSYYATDPALTASTAAYTGDSQMNGDLPSPSSAASTFFAESRPSEPVYEFDDGQTPMTFGVPVQAGTVLTTTVEYSPAAGGFPDSTKGLAGLPSEASNSASPFTPLRDLSKAPFPAVSEGGFYGVRAGLHPDLKAAPMTAPAVTFDVFEHRAQERRLRAGNIITDSAALRQEDKKLYQREMGRRTRESKIQQQQQSYAGAQQQPLLGQPVIR